jgi:hypothetical protein
MWLIKDKPKTVIINRKDLLELLPPTNLITVAEDRVFICPRLEQVEEQLQSDSTKYVPEYNDCDDFAYRAKGKIAGRCWAFGVIKIKLIKGCHMLNCFVNEKKEFILWEPQTRSKYTGENLGAEYIII